MLKTITTILILTTLLLAEGPVLKTGQVKSYDQDGTIVTDGSIKDDGYYRAGKARSYGRSGDVVIDNATGLEWQDDVESVVKKWEDSGKFPAATYCNMSTLGDQRDWRVPSIDELLTLSDTSHYNPSVTEGIFSHISSSGYWSSTNNAGNTSSAWGVDFYYGGSYVRTKANDYYVRCVRGGQFEPSHFSRNDGTDIVTDLTTGLQWQDDDAEGSTNGDWTSAIDYCENTLVLGGYSDWRLPNRNELYSIVDFSQWDPAIYPVFETSSSSNYWSSSVGASHTSYAWYVNFYFGSTYYRTKTYDNYVRCVRGGQFDTSALPSIIMYLLN